MTHPRLLLFLLPAIAFGCTRGSADGRDSAEPPVVQAAADSPATLPASAVTQLRWLEGSWRGSGAGPGWERTYRLTRVG